jgi:hypothetical protein
LSIRMIPIPALLIIISIVAHSFYNASIKNMDKIIDKNTDKLLKLQNEMVSAESLFEIRRSLDRSFSEIERDLYSLDSAINLVKRVNEEARYYEVALSDFQFDLPTYINFKTIPGSGGAIVVPFECMVKGNYLKIGKFMSSLEKRHFIKNINSIRADLDISGNANIIAIFKGDLQFFDLNSIR